MVRKMGRCCTKCVRALALPLAFALSGFESSDSAAPLTSLESVRAYAVRWQHELAAVVAEELYEQNASNGHAAA